MFNFVSGRYLLVGLGKGVVVVVSRPVVLLLVPPGVVGEFGPIMTAAADSFLADAVVGFMKLREAEAVDLVGDLIVDELVEAVEDNGRSGLDRDAVMLLVAVMLGVEVADKLKVTTKRKNK